MAHGLSTTDVPLFAALGIWIFNVGMLVLMGYFHVTRADFGDAQAIVN